MRGMLNLSRHSKMKSHDTLPNAAVKSIKVTIIFVLKYFKLSIPVFNKKTCRSCFSKYSLCQNAISLDTNIMIRLHKQCGNTLYKVGNSDMYISQCRWVVSIKVFFRLCCMIACFHVFGSFPFIDIMLNNLKI